MDYKILIIDDDEPMHILTKNLLGNEFDLTHAHNAQKAIDILSEEKFNLILSDIHMPGISGLEFLESVMKDAEKQQIPVLIMTNLPTVEKEKKALDLGAADFIDKTLFTTDRDEILKRVQMKLVTNVEIPEMSDDLASKKNKLVSKMMSEAIKGNFESTVDTLCRELNNQLDIDYVSFWTVNDGKPKRIGFTGPDDSNYYSDGNLENENSYQVLLDTRNPYMTNHVFNDDLGMLPEFSEKHDLPAEVGVPLFSVNERKLLVNNMEVPEGTPMYGFLVLKRNKLFSSKEFEILSRLLVQTGSILWRLSQKG